MHTTSKPTFRCKGSGYIWWADRDVLEDVHEAIVTKKVWQTANDIIDRHTKVKPSSSGYENIFRGLLKCVDCGQTLLVHTDGRNPDRKVIDRTCYECTTYRKKGVDFCTAHRINARDIEDAVKADIEKHAVKAMKDKEKFINNVLLNMGKSSAELERQQKEKSEAAANAEQFTESLAQCAGMKKPTATVLNSLIEKIEVHNPVMVNGAKEQKLTIYYKFVGQID